MKSQSLFLAVALIASSSVSAQLTYAGDIGLGSSQLPLAQHRARSKQWAERDGRVAIARAAHRVRRRHGLPGHDVWRIYKSCAYVPFSRRPRQRV
jgi:hypothetical protein